MTTLFRNAQQATNYAKFRPSYPPALYERIASRLAPSERRLAVDVGCGTGQATLALADYFAQVQGIDLSAAQLAHIAADSYDAAKVSFARHDAVGGLRALPAASVSCVTAAQAAHWFDLPAFYAQVDRVLQPGGVLALWTYGLLEFAHADLEQRVNRDLYQDLLGDYWDTRRVYVERKYATLPAMNLPGFCTERLENVASIPLACGPTALAGYVRSWSAYQSYCQAHDIATHSPEDPVANLEAWMATQGITLIEGSWPLTLVLSQKQRVNG
jgi:SAM-dependent methyltransferase